MREYMQFDEARSFVQGLNLNGVNGWKGYCKSKEKPANIPSNPNVKYSDKGWKGYSDWLGIVSFRSREFQQFEEARSFVQGLNLKGVNGWKEYCKSKEKPTDIPSNPNVKYSDKGWKCYNDWLGLGT
jgi:hypothetical protein